MKSITHRIRWWIALIADLLVFIPSSIRSGSWQRLGSVSPWMLVFCVSGLGLFALAIVQLWEWLESHSTPTVDIAGLLATERTERDRLLASERTERDRLIDCVNYKVDTWVQRTNETLNSLIPKPTPEPTLKEKTTQLAKELFALMEQMGTQPVDPLSVKGGKAEQDKAMKEYWDWKRSLYYRYMAYFKDRTLKTDYELAAAGFMTKLDDDEISPPKNSVEVNVKKIAETLLLLAQKMP